MKGAVIYGTNKHKYSHGRRLKKQFDAFCSDIGMSMTTAFCVFAKTAVRERRIPFEISAESDPFYSPANMAKSRKTIAQMEQTGGTIHEVNLDD